MTIQDIKQTALEEIENLLDSGVYYVYEIKDELKSTISTQLDKLEEEVRKEILGKVNKIILETLPIYVVGKSSPFEMRNEERDSLIKKLLSITNKDKQNG